MRHESGCLFTVFIISRFEQGIEFTHLRDPLTRIRISGKQILDKASLRLVQLTIYIGEKLNISGLFVGTH